MIVHVKLANFTGARGEEGFSCPNVSDLLLNAGTAQEQLAKCDAVKPEERKLWESQDVVTGALPHALSEAFQTVEHDFLQTNKVGALVSPRSL